MAIKIVDMEPADAGKPKKAKRAKASPVAREPHAEALNESGEPELPHAAPAQAKRGRN